MDKGGIYRRRVKMNSRKQYGELQATSSNGAASQPQFTPSHNIEVEVVEESSPAPFMVHVEGGSIAYEILLLQQRLEAYERLHIEELAELRTEVERLRRAFLQEMNDHLRPLSSVRSLSSEE